MSRPGPAPPFPARRRRARAERACARLGQPASALRREQTDVDPPASRERLAVSLLARRARGFPHADGVDTAQLDPVALHEVADDGVDALARQPVVVAVGAARIGEALELDDRVGIGLECPGDLLELVDAVVAQLRLVEVEVDGGRFQLVEPVAVGESLGEPALGLAQRGRDGLRLLPGLAGEVLRVGGGRAASMAWVFASVRSAVSRSWAPWASIRSPALRSVAVILASVAVILASVSLILASAAPTCSRTNPFVAQPAPATALATIRTVIARFMTVPPRSSAGLTA
jgi:hypothetical protein